jgi:hypothetical protein
VFSEAEFLQRITDLLLAASPDIIAAKIVMLRARLLEFAIKNGWT